MIIKIIIIKPTFLNIPNNLEKPKFYSQKTRLSAIIDFCQTVVEMNR